MSKIAIIQPLVPHYREAFFKKLGEKKEIDLFVYAQDSMKSEYNLSVELKVNKLKHVFIGKAVLYDIIPFLSSKYKFIILCNEDKLLSNWLLLLFGKLIGKRIVLWGHGFDAKKYEKYKTKLPIIKRFGYMLAAGAWFYTENERKMWHDDIPTLKSVSLNNSIDILPMLKYKSIDKEIILEKYHIHSKINFIFCARFSNPNRRVDLLIKLIESLDPNKYGFIIIGDGDLKPDFSQYINVYDFGAVYERDVKNELFAIADIYFQPGELGLSVVEAMAYAKPIFTFKRSINITHGVEYAYIKNGENGKVFDSFENLCHYVEKVDLTEIRRLGSNAKEYVENNLGVDQMVTKAISGLSMLND